MVADTQALTPVGDRPSPVKNWLTVKAVPWVRRYRDQAKTSTTVRSVPGVTAMLAWSVAAAGAVNYFADGLGWCAGVGVFAWFMTRLDSRIG